MYLRWGVSCQLSLPGQFYGSFGSLIAAKVVLLDRCVRVYLNRYLGVIISVLLSLQSLGWFFSTQPALLGGGGAPYRCCACPFAKYSCL